jgi:hypothetical protein
MKKDALENAWRVHEAHSEWTARVDAKATFAFTVESAVLATVVALTTSDRVFDDFDALWKITAYSFGLLLIFASTIFAGIVVAPRLRGKGLLAGSADNYIYFGHTRFWEHSASELADRFREDDLLTQLTRQIGVMGRIAWRKHVFVQWSLWLAMSGSFVLVLTIFLLKL